MGWKSVAHAAGVTPSTVGHVLYGKYPHQPEHPEHRPPRKRVTRQVAEKLLAVKLNLAGGALVHQAGTVRRLQALIVCGWSGSELGRRLGWTSANIWALIHGTRGQVTTTTAAKVRALYDELWDQPPPGTTRYEKQAATRARNLARSWGWAPPLAWDDEDLDNPYAVPETDTPSTRPTGRPATVDLDDVDWLLDGGTSLDEIAARMGVTVGLIEQARRDRQRRAA
ncbi:hypothetical protein ACQBAU_16135 [Propionibacteriaceae bacterium Y2011]